MQTLGRLAVVVLILVMTGISVRRIAEARNEVAAGPGVYALEVSRTAAMGGYSTLLEQLRRAEQSTVVDRLEAHRASGTLWIAPGLPSGLRAVYVSTLRTVRRIYVAERELTAQPSALYPGLHVPPAHLRAFSWIMLAGTLVHEMAHAEGLADESAAYAAEIEWYRGLKDVRALRDGPPEEVAASEWAIDAAIGNAERAQASAR